MKLNVSCAEFYQEVNDEVELQSTGLFQHLMTNFSKQLGSLQGTELAAIEAETRRVQAEARLERITAKMEG